MNVPETFYIALCVTILMLGVVYWFWTQIQYLQRKVNLLDNVVYEMKTLVSNLPGHSGGNDSSHQAPPFRAEPEYHIAPQQEDSAPYAPPPESVAGDLDAERVASEMEFIDYSGHKEYNEPPADEPRFEGVTSNDIDTAEVVDELRPGGLAVSSEGEDSKKLSFDMDTSSLESPLNSMSIKELRRMAEANNIPGATEMRKRDLVRVLRNKVGTIMKNVPSDSIAGVVSLDSIEAPTSD